MQGRRVLSRGTLWHYPDTSTGYHHWGVHDSHDNPWQLLQLGAALPIALGLKV